tara:strand:+ start:144 stop:506 length:363 start_codon:yes stop_codon:yes gene_type:complete
MKVKIISKPNQTLKYVNPDFDTEGIDDEDYEYIYCEEFFDTGYVDDYGAAHMLEYDYNTGVVKFQYEGTESDLIAIAQEAGESRIDFIDAFLKRIRFFEEVFKIEWEVCEYIGDDGFDWA